MRKICSDNRATSVVVAGEACMGLALGVQILIALWEMWIKSREKMT
jgi:hypothetical protein